MLHTALLYTKPTRLLTLSPTFTACLRLNHSTTTIRQTHHYHYKYNCQQKVSFSSSSSSSSSSTNSTASDSNKKHHAGSNLPLFSKSFWTHKKVWVTTTKNTFRCLVGCTLGDFSTMWLLQSMQVSTPLCMGISMGMGILTSLLLETFFLRKLGFFNAVSTAMQMSFLSMLTMELTENLVDLYLTGGVVQFHSASFWISAVISALAGFLVPLPLNYWRLRRLGKCCH